MTRQFETNSSHVPTHLLDVREGLGIFLVFAKVQYGFLTASSNICHGQFSQKEVFFEAPCTYGTEWVNDWWFGPLWSDNLQLPYTSKSEVIWDQTTSNFLVYNLQLPHITSNFLMVAIVIMVATVMLVRMVMVVRTGRDGTVSVNDDVIGVHQSKHHLPGISLIVIFNCCFVDIVYVFVSFDDDVIGVCERASSKHHFPGISLIAPPPVTPGKRLSQTTLCSGWWWWCRCWCWRRWWHDNWWVWLIGSSLWLTSKSITTESTENNVLLLIKVETRSFQRDSSMRGVFFLNGTPLNS